MPLNTGVYPRLPGFMLLFRDRDTPYVPVLPSRLSPVEVFPTASPHSGSEWPGWP